MIASRRSPPVFAFSLFELSRYITLQICITLKTAQITTAPDFWVIIEFLTENKSFKAVDKTSAAIFVENILQSN